MCRNVALMSSGIKMAKRISRDVISEPEPEESRNTSVIVQAHRVMAEVRFHTHTHTQRKQQ